MFKYTYTTKLVDNLGKIRELVISLNERRYPNTVLMQFEKSARALSAYSSTSIEGNPLPLTDVKKILKSKPENIRDTEKEVLNYNNALLYLDKLFKKSNRIEFSNKLILSIHKIVVTDLLLSNSLGKYRQQPVFVNDPIARETVYWPPDHQEIEKRMNELIEFVNTGNSKTDNIIKAGIFHQQFVILHPFLDGNGRSVRLLTKVLLAKLGLNKFQLFSFENYYNNNITKYFNKVGAKGDYYDISPDWDFTMWLEYFTDGIIDELLRVTKVLPKVSTLEEKLEEHHLKILELLNDSVIVKDSDYAKVTTRTRATRFLDFQKLIDLGMIERKGAGRGSYYVLSEVG